MKSRLTDAQIPPVSVLLPQAAKRSSERVVEYLRAEFERPHMKEGSRLPTIQQIATHLHVSVPTVHAVFKRLASEGRIRSRTGQGSFLVAPHAHNKTYRVALSLDFPKHAPLASFPSRLLGGMYRGAAESRLSVSFVPLIHFQSVEESLQELIDKRTAVDGLVLFPSPGTDRIRELYEEEGTPVVDYNPPRELATVNFVSFDYFGESLRVGTAFGRTGRRRAALLLGNPIMGTVSGRLRRLGLETGMGVGLGGDLQLRIAEGRNASEEQGAVLTQKLLEARYVPDGVFCISDYLALGAVKALRAHGLRVPQDVSVVGGTGLDLSETDCPTLTRVRQPLEEAGEAVMKMLGRRMLRKAEPVPGRVLPTRFIGGATTLPAENEELGIRKSR